MPARTTAKTSAKTSAKKTSGNRIKMKLKKGDRVRVMTGKHRGAEGKVVEVDAVKNRVTIENVNVVKKAQKPTQQNPKGGFSEREASVHASNVRLLDPQTNAPSRVAYKRLDNGRKVRVSVKSGAQLES
jgi:large subunit ribosomal protein L24